MLMADTRNMLPFFWDRRKSWKRDMKVEMPGVGEEIAFLYQPFL